ncbi:surface protein containing Ig-like domains [Anoxybacillus gonensis]|uniref:DUF5057 domain-containing protein n=1 Tax=Anoxybacillus gonensis TaxID=198467 RepID=A0AAW7TGP8_9BACL|nr:DUF5057 domain-containing protein [Anoxybacillus gonensis]AKS39104.1 surface protein containing Ig-like domains [Anoxybacillus gonensis]KGP61217.1 surface protein containing Ig-like domains [Anoxybacillus gonensis]MDO0876871.1 DUF5057 domain-containing protein [Anoxybacillus gonensis]
MKRAVSVFLTLLLLVPLFTPVMTVRATDNITYNVLEIVSHADQLSSSPLKKELGSTSNINVTTMTMKRFVALRDELDGKYDAIVISSGDYNPTKLGKMSGNTQAHNTANVLNDITDLKARQIKTFYIDKGLPVFLHDSSVKKYPTSKLYSYSQSNAWKTKQNVIFFTTNTNIKNYFASNGTKRPHFVLTNAPSPTKTYKKGDTLSFVYQITNYTQFQNKWLTVNLYIDSDFNDKYTSEEIVASKQVQGATGTISYTLPAGYSGPRYWKVEIVDETSALKDYVKGFVKFQDVVANIKVLQIRKGNDASSLLNTKNMNPNFLSRTNEYNIHIDVTTLDDFQKSKTYEPNYSHEVINGKYDMIIFGFADCYNGCGSTTLNPNAVQSVKNFIQSGQSVMFTHDVMFGENNIWVNEFGSIVGQIQPWTDLGNGAPNPSTSTKQVNSGLMTNYPFQLGENISIALTHNQYYTLNLEDENIISWYNIVGSSRDVYDSWNHYYTYSNGNVTYSGTGHVGTTSAFPEEEQKLFVNTMYRAFFGSNHAPQLTVVTPQENEKIPSNQPIELSYKVEDLDLVDRTFSTKVWLNGQEVYAENNVPNGKMIIQSIPHNMPDGGTATIKIEATDARGAKVTKEFQVVIEKVSANIEVNRAISTTLTPVNEPIAMQYTVTPKPLSLLTNTLLKVTNIAFEEKLPAGIEVVSLPNGFTKQGTVTEGYTIKGTLPDISFVKSGTTYIAEPQTFTIQVKPTAKGTFSLSQAKLTYKDINTQVVNVSFNVVSFVSDYKITDATLPSTIFVNRGVPKNARLLLNVLPQEATIASVEWSENSHGQVISIDQNGVITAIQEGTAQVTAKVKDMFGNVKTTTMTVIVRIPVDSITIQNFTVYVGETIPIPINVSPADAKKAVSYSLGNSLYAEVNGATGTITGLKEGVTTLTVQAFNRNDELIEKTVTVTIEAIPVTAVVVSPTVVNMNIGETATLAATVAPNNATYKTIEWRSSNPNIASVDENGRVTGLSTGQVTITAQAHNGVIGTAIVHVGSPLTGISLPSTLLVQKGKTINVLPYIAPIPANATTKIVSRSFAVGNSYYAVVDQNGEVTAKRLGETPLTVKLVDETGKTWTASTVIRIVEQATDPTKGGNKNGWLY